MQTKAVLGWAGLAVVFGWGCWGILVLLAISSTGAGTFGARYAGFYFAMLVAGLVAAVAGLPFAFTVALVWQFISRKFPALDQTWTGILSGSVAVAFAVSLLYYLAWTRAFDDGMPYGNTSVGLFAIIVGGLVLPRKLYSWLRPGTFATR